MKLKKAKHLINGLFTLMLFFCALGYAVDSLVFCILAGITLLVMIFVQFAFWRCPHCGTFLGRIGGSAKYCPDCGKELYEEL